ncbi:MAG: hypothetical protein D3904_12775, partial [Candidatus Electrothrix sp. EH2]|nr:hypothetical protein [Candidatus Electrothrix sp. EH2]
MISIQENPQEEVDIRAAQALAHGLLPQEGIEVFEQVLYHRQAQVLVAKQGLTALFRQVEKGFAPHLSTTPVQPTTEKSRPTSVLPYLAPRTVIEEQLATIWQKFLGISPIGVTDDFFEFGGDSLLAVQLAAYLRSQLKVELSTQVLLNAPTIQELAGLIAETQDESSGESSSDA